MKDFIQKRNSIILLLIVTSLILFSLLLTTDPQSFPPTDSREKLLHYVNETTDRIPRYQTWKLFPNSGAGDPLGLPVHGRFTTVYVNNIAFKAATKWLQTTTLDQFVDFPAGSIIVKANTYIDPKSSPQPPGVLTIMYKPGIKGYCQTKDYWSEKGCYGGKWMFVFYEVPDGPLAHNVKHNFDNDVITRDFCVTCHAAGSDDDYVRSLQRLRRAAQPATRPGTVDNVTAMDNIGDPFCNDPNLSPKLPSDVAINPISISDKKQRQRMFDCLSWRSFIALNWPVAKSERGEPDTKAKLWDSKLDGYVANSDNQNPADFHPRTRVWETYKEVYELFQTGPNRFDWNPATQQPPLAWNKTPPNPVGKGCEKVNGAKVLMMTQKNRTASLSPRTGEGLINESVQAFAGQFGVLVDQNGKLVRYDVRMNRSEYEYILDNGYATTAKITPDGPQGVLATRLTLPDNRSQKYGKWGGTIELKGSWRELCTDKKSCKVPDELSRYFTESVWIYEAGANNQGTCRSAVMGLVGMHIAHKTHWAPQWIWSTFEHIDLVPENPGQPGQKPHALFNPACVNKEKALSCEDKPFLAAAPCCPNVPFDKKLQGKFTPNQVTRLQAIEPATAELNKTFGVLTAGSPFENYILVGTQWPFKGRKPGNEAEIYTRPCNANVLRGHLNDDCYTIVPQFLRNTSMESFMASYYQPDKPNQLHQFSNRGCMNCHGEAGADFSYLWLDAVNQRVRSVVKSAE